MKFKIQFRIQGSRSPRQKCLTSCIKLLVCFKLPTSNFLLLKHLASTLGGMERNRRMTSSRGTLFSLVGSVLLDGGQSFGVRFFPQQTRLQQSRRISTLPKMHMSAVEPMVSLLLAADGAQSLRYSRTMGSVGMQRVAWVDTTVDANTRIHYMSCLPRTAVQVQYSYNLRST